MNVSLAVSCWCVFRMSYKITQALDVSRLLMWTFLPSWHSSVLIRHIANLCVCLVVQSTLINRSLALMSFFECVTDSFFPHPNNTIRFIQSQRLQELSPLCFCTRYHRVEDRKKSDLYLDRLIVEWLDGWGWRKCWNLPLTFLMEKLNLRIAKTCHK